MGVYLFDQYSLLHFSVGVIFYFWGVSLTHSFLAHFIFEIVENTDMGIEFINEKMKYWPGGKPKADLVINIVGDNLSMIAGWIVANRLDGYGKDKKWYIKN